MKIERLNEHQIRCVLTKKDLDAHAIKLSELAYGSEKAKGLFRALMTQAEKEFGFEAEDIPLMIEAIPYSEHIVLIITKVEDPDELDSKFSSFTKDLRDGNPALDEMIQELSNAVEALDLFKKIQDCATAPNNKCIFIFSTLTHVQKLARVTGATYQASNTLYKDDAYDTYILVTTRGDHSEEEYNRFCNTASEYGDMHKSLDATVCYLKEHFKPIVKDNALQTLSQL